MDLCGATTPRCLQTILRKLFTAVVGMCWTPDAISTGSCRRAFKPLGDDMIVAGRALPVLENDVDPDIARAVDGVTKKMGSCRAMAGSIGL